MKFLLVLLSVVVLFATAVLMDSYSAHLLPVPANLTTIVAMGAAIIGFYGPGMFLKNRSTKRGALESTPAERERG